MTHRVTLVPGDTTGPELASAVRRIVDCSGASVTWDEHFLTDSGKIPSSVLDSLRQHKVGLMGYHHASRARNEAPPIVRLRKAFGMFANVRPVRSLPGISSRHDDIDLVVVRETTEDIYAHLEHESIPGVYESLKVTTRDACERIARYAFAYAREYGRKRVTIVHKANIMKKSDGMFLRVAREVATEFPDIEAEDVIVDALCMKLVIRPSQFEVLVAGNLYGDIVADLAAGLAGGAANSPSINVGPDLQVFASPHGDPPELQTSNKGNPLSLVLPAVEMLRHLGEANAANRIHKAVLTTLESGQRPIALGGSTGCAQFAHAVCEHMEA